MHDSEAEIISERHFRYAVSQCQKGRSTADTAAELKVTRRRVQQLWAEFCSTGRHHVQDRPGRRPSPPTQGDPDLVMGTHKTYQAGVLYTAKRLRKAHVISYRLVYQIMKKNGLVVPSAAKSMKRKWVRFERRYSNAMWHVDWHEMKEPRFRGLQLVTYLDDSSRCIMASMVFTQATSENAVLALRDAIRRFGTPATILSDNGSCFVGRGSRNASGKTWKATAFEAELLDRGIELINSRPHHPQTNGKLEMFHRSIENELGRHESMSEYVRYYNEERLHGSLDIDDCEMSLLAFGRRKATESIRKSNPKWMEEDLHDEAK